MISVKVDRRKQVTWDRRRWNRVAKAWVEETEALVLAALKKEAPIYKTQRGDRNGPKVGELRDSLRAKAVVSGENVNIEFFTNVSYAKFVLKGTAGHTITPVRANVLYWEADGVQYFRNVVHHPGGKKNDFVTRAIAPLVPKISARFKETVISGMESAT